MKNLTEKFRDKEKARQISSKIEEISKSLDQVNLMNVCGTHEMTIVKHGLRSLIPENARLVAGPGCPVCVTPANEIDEAVKLAEDGNIVTTFGDMYRVPGTESSLEKAKTEGADVEIVYGISDAAKIAEENPDREVIHAAVGFETTAPTTAAEISRNPPENFHILSNHRIMPPIMEFMLSSEETEIDGYICPGHVSTIIGSKPYETLSEKFGISQVIAGFEPLDVLLAVLMLLQQIEGGRHEVENEYDRFVKYEGNEKAKTLIEKVFEPVDGVWRGFPTIPKSNLTLRKEYEEYDARKNFDLDIERKEDFAKGCRCGEVLKGMIEPPECPLFLEECSPESPVGPCMVSSEGTCSVRAKHGETR